VRDPTPWGVFLRRPPKLRSSKKKKAAYFLKAVRRPHPPIHEDRANMPDSSGSTLKKNVTGYQGGCESAHVTKKEEGFSEEQGTRNAGAFHVFSATLHKK